MSRLDDMLKEMIKLGGSDLHLCSTLPPRIRQHGNLMALDRPPISPEEMTEILKEAADRKSVV